MRFSGLRINNLRNHIETDVKFNDVLNVFFGLNGSGKTSILESIAICGFSKTFLPVSDSSLINFDFDFYSISADAVNDLNVPYKINIAYEKGKKKKINSSIADNMLPKDIIGVAPIVVLSPDYKAITFGSPDFRRQFLDRLLSQSSKFYMEELYKFKRAIKQRNALLSMAKFDRRFDLASLSPWTNVLILSGSELIYRRMKFVEEFRNDFKETYRTVSDGKETVDLEYVSYIINGTNTSLSLEQIKDKMSDIFQKSRNDEIQRGVTLFGPQKDDLKIMINGGVAKEVASQGQHKSLLISIKLAEFNFLLSKRKETPLILLDDIFSELDGKRMEKVFDLIWSNSAQTFITVTEPNSIKSIIGQSKRCSFFEVDNGFVNYRNGN
jgi:DNA replication and repair protein RecF